MNFKLGLSLAFLTILTLSSTINVWAVDSVDRLEVYDVTCEKARKRLHEEARKQCIFEGNQLQSSTPKTCEAVKDPYTHAERFIQHGEVKCTIRQ